MDERARLLRRWHGRSGQFLNDQLDLQGVSPVSWLRLLLDPSVFSPLQTGFDYSNMPVHGTSSYQS
ncbi:MAG: hypothetical protein VX346_16660 [Planctomycetota bacterium]|nr:hypothetical protein [Planctomycetota bacterium]